MTTALRDRGPRGAGRRGSGEGRGSDARPLLPALRPRPWVGVSWGGGRGTVGEKLHEFRVDSQIHEKSLETFCFILCDATITHTLTMLYLHSRPLRGPHLPLQGLQKPSRHLQL